MLLSVCLPRDLIIIVFLIIKLGFDKAIVASIIMFVIQVLQLRMSRHLSHRDKTTNP